MVKQLISPDVLGKMDTAQHLACMELQLGKVRFLLPVSLGMA